jgi:hypothetical protein
MGSNPSEAIRYVEIEPRLRTGDVFLFHGASRRSRVIEEVTRSRFSHIGMIVRTDQAKPPLLWHSDPRAVTEDSAEDRPHPGAQLNDLAAAMAVMTNPDYGDTPYVRQLILERRPELNEIALQAIAAMDETSFPSLLKIVKEWTLGKLHIATSEPRMDCAEVVAVTYQRMGLLAPEPPANAYAPNDFSAKHEKLKLLEGAALGPQLQVLWP